LLITRSPTKFLAMLSSTLAFADAPAMDMVATSAIPIISAEAVAAVRRGLRSEFCPASRPTLPNRGPVACGREQQERLRDHGLATATPSRAARMPPPTQ
jgi:hypothetical protein